MSIRNREDIRDLINKIETSYPVNEWMHNGYHIWPVLRIRLYLTLVKQNEDSRGSSKTFKKSSNKIVKKIREIPEALNSYFKLKTNIKTIYCGAPSHRINYNGKKYNRYFELPMDQEKKNNLLIEIHSESKKKYYKPERVVLFSVLNSWYNLYYRQTYNPKKVERYAEDLGKILLELEINIKKLDDKILKWVLKIDQAIFFFGKILGKLNTEKIYILCYYSASMLGLTIAAHRRGIITIDVQHGPQGESHMAYGSWHNVSREGYEALPNEFHTWDESSAKCINEWANDTDKHAALVTGNPWVEGWKKDAFKSNDYPWPENLILYTLQPVGNPLEPYLLEAIHKTCDKWNWWLRVHPRQMGEVELLKKELREYGLLDRVNLDDATSLLLPEILMNTKVHLTKFSGCAIEAFNFKTPTVILDQRGKKIFKDYLQRDLMSSCLMKNSDSLIQAIKQYM